MKDAHLVKIANSEPQFETLLRNLLDKVPFLHLVSLKKEANNGNNSKSGGATRLRPDWTGEVRAGNRSWTLLVEAKQIGQPRQIRAAALQLQHYLALLPEDLFRYGIVLAPFISEQSARICEETGLGYADFAGNARISFDNVFIETRSPDNPFRERREVRWAFRPESLPYLEGFTPWAAPLVEGR